MARIRTFLIFTTTALLLFVSFSISAADAPPLTLLKRWHEGIDPTGWWMSEKYDGIRGYWDGKMMWSRQGQPIAIPDTFRAQLPPFPVDGELWSGRGRFEQTAAIVRDAVPGSGWSKIHYMVFEAPGHGGPFEARIAALQAWLRQHPSAAVRVVKQIRCGGKAQLLAFLHRVERKGGEGVVLHAAHAPYAAGRSDYLLKVKSFEDNEAKVVGYNPGRGKYTGMVGSLRVELPNGTRFSLGSGLSDGERRSPPPIGSIVTFKYQGLTAKGKPRFPVFWRVRELPAGLPARK